ncbi:MAG: MerR family transcriptional regulator [Rhodoglobus sp.]|nr:MerR family transcriptional regulator [Rhodoglobus sp.]
MKMSKLCETSGVSVPSIKFYLREGLLPAGERTSATQAEYGDDHVDRLRLIRALIDIGGLSVATAGRVLEAIDSPDLPLSYVFGVAQYAVSDASLYADDLPAESAGVVEIASLIDQLGWVVSDDNPGRIGAARVLDTYAELGQTLMSALLPQYAAAAETIATADLAAVAHNTEVADMAETVVVGTVLGDALNASLRRMAQEHISHQLFPASRDTSPRSSL